MDLLCLACKPQPYPTENHSEKIINSILQYRLIKPISECGIILNAATSPSSFDALPRILTQHGALDIVTNSKDVHIMRKKR